MRLPKVDRTKNSRNFKTTSEDARDARLPNLVSVKDSIRPRKTIGLLNQRMSQYFAFFEEVATCALRGGFAEHKSERIWILRLYSIPNLWDLPLFSFLRQSLSGS